MIKAVFFDIDGTLLSHRTNRVPQSAVASIKALQKKGIKTILATGRHTSEIAALPLGDLVFDAYITMNGQLCHDSEGNVFYKRPISDTGRILDLFRNKIIPVMLADEKRVYFNYVNDTVRRVQQEILTPVPPIDEYRGGDLYLAVLIVTKEREAEYTADIPGIAVTRWNDFAVDVVNAGGSKVDGIREYLKINGILPEEAAAFGDGENDIGMLRFVGHGIAMGNSDEATKDASEFVSSDIDDDGILHGLQVLNIL